jgi:DNA-binding response OmpR family regulator
MSRPKIGEVMVELGAFGPSAVARVLMEQAQGQPGRFGEIAARLGLVDAAAIGRAVAKQFGLRFAEDDALARLSPPAEAMGLLPAPLCRERRLVATYFDAGEKILTLLCADPTDVPALKEAQRVSGAARLRLVIATPAALDALTARLMPEAKAVAPPARSPLLFEPEPDRRAALRALMAAEGDRGEVVATAEQVRAALEDGGVGRVLYPPHAAAEVNRAVDSWRRLSPGIHLTALPGYSPFAAPPVPWAAARGFLFALVERLLLAAEAKHLDLRARVRREAELARALGASLKLPEEERDALALAALFVELDKLSVFGHLNPEHAARGAATSRHAAAIALLEPLGCPWPVVPLLRGLEARDESGQTSRSLAVEALRVALRVCQRPITADADAAGLLGDAAQGVPAEVLSALNAALRRERLTRSLVGGDGGRPRVLVAERDPATLTALDAALTQAGFEVAFAADGEEALALARSQPFAAVLLATRMPRKDGFTALYTLKRDPETARLPVLLLTEPGNPKDQARGLELGAEDVLERPVNFPVLLARLRRMAASAPAVQSAGIGGQLQDLPLVELVQTLTLGGKTAHITVTSGGDEALLALESGRLVYARLGAQSGAAAFFTAAAWRAGRFEVRMNAAAPGQNVAESGDFLMLEALRRMDEGGR